MDAHFDQILFAVMVFSMIQTVVGLGWYLLLLHVLERSERKIDRLIEALAVPAERRS
jgi:hypothetical protein